MPEQNYFVLNQSAQYYETGFSCDNALVLCTQDGKIFFTDMRYVLEAKQNVKKGVEVRESKDLYADLGKVVKQLKISRLCFDPKELSLSDYNLLLKSLESTKTKLIQKPNFHQKLRIIKTDKQIALIQKSQQLNKKAFKAFAHFIRKQLTKTKRLSESKLHFYASEFLSDFGDYELSFNPIVGINATGAKPHALPSADIFLQKNDLLLFDAGIKFRRYCSDRTRTAQVDENMSFSKKQRFKNPKQQKIYDIVRKAQEKAITQARSGMKASQIDSLAREVIESSGYGKYFVHSTGHGIGLDIHELPIISARSDEIIEDGMVFSIEPGIYLGGKFGVRIEDLVVMRDGKAQII